MNQQHRRRRGFALTRVTAASVSLLLSTITTMNAWGQIAPATDSPSFDRGVARIFAERCLSCHRGSEPKGELDLSGQTAAMAGGESGVVIVPGDLDSSYLWQLVSSGEMPPKDKLSDDEKQAIRRWITDGAEWGTDPIDPFAFSTTSRAGYDWWSLQPLQEVSVPEIASDDWCHNEIDAFVLARLRNRDLQPSPRADARTLVRRLYFDLIGLPPPIDVVDAFSKNATEAAWAELVDRLLASPHYGERWARHWMDIARFGESDGYEYNRPRENLWHYRDWLIRAFNRDMPYDEFTRMQLAGDILRPGTLEGAAAAGFLVAGTHNTIVGVNAVMKQSARHDELEELAGTVGQTFLGMTVHCARCHDHKFDPITAREYYAFISALDGIQHGNRKLPSEPEFTNDTGTENVYSVEAGNPGVMHLLQRGDVRLPGEEVRPGGIAAIQNLSPEFELAATAADSARRTQLANWITHHDNAIFHRVVVNRIWHYHFGKGLVASPSDFGFQGGVPSHAELLDWLSQWFRRNGYSIKRLHRLIVTSATYQQASGIRDSASTVDRDNRMLWRQNPRRMEAEVLRDSILEIAGQLNRQPYGPGFRDVRIVEVGPAFYYLPSEPFGIGMQRRTIYRWNVRGQRSALLDTFDCPDPSTRTPRRMVTTTAPQALSQWNSRFMLRMSQHFADRIQRESNSIDGQINRAWCLAFGRRPTAEEHEQAASLVREHGLTLMCRILFNSNEFVWID